MPDDFQHIENIENGICLIDISAKMPKHRSLEYGTRSVDQVERIYVHHSGKLGLTGKRARQGAINSAKYSISPPRPGAKKKKTVFPGAAYHFWIPFSDPDEIHDAFVFYRMNPDEVVCWHTGGLNSTGIGICCQGNTSRNGLSDSQKEILEALIPWCWVRYRLKGPDALSWHSETGRFPGGRPKKNCPGKAAEAWVKAYRALIDSPI